MGYPVIDMVATGERIHCLMRENGLSAKQVADFMGFGAPQAVYKWLRGDSLPTLDNMYALSLLLHTNMESILVGNGGGVFLCPLFLFSIGLLLPTMGAASSLWSANRFSLCPA
ncbi:MAG: helix-turn-helix domain-containing protein [Lachnospiraceae bacterium]|nr:helix-turn-helix domain-containing protein [Lachnospiraceae bacterium]